ncbi:hydroxyacid dehydrogenase [Kribbella catacumbae]|uniref:hydroxyacid dehydrogenase n=1 Tax=Kribbella catacumbae TaxID=460086 RepID=UPI000374FADB|nr:hydroxyacid dehydrogenase [Kribbella catacumbae]
MSHRHDAPPPSTRSRLLVCVPAAETDAFFPPATQNALEKLGDVVRREPVDLLKPEAFQEALNGVEVLITGWGFPRLDGAHLALAPQLRFVMHSASSLRALISDAFWNSGIPVSQAGAAMAPAVAELSLTFTLSLLRRTHRLDHALRSGQGWQQARRIERARELGQARIGVIGASRTGRSYVAACQALGAEVQLYDPHLSPDDPLSSLSVTLPQLLATSDVVAVHAPATAETAGMIGAGEIAALPDGAAVVNTARSSILDMDAMFEAVASGRIDAALDVFDLEPLPEADRWRSLPNVLLTPHLAGATRESRWRAGWIVVDEIRRYLAGEPLQHAVSRADFERMG